MQPNAGKTPGLNPLRYLNQPQPIRIQTNARGLPVAVIQGRQRMKIQSITDLWEVSDEWWRATPIWRRYFQVTLASGRQLTIFQDLLGGGWHTQNA